MGPIRSTPESGSSSPRSSHVVNELMMYLQMGPIEVPDGYADFDLLAWGKANESKFQVLSAMSVI